MKISPIIVSVYDRLEHLKRCIASLAENRISIYSDLFIISDGPYSREAGKKIANVREIIPRFKGFSRITAIERPTNIGSFQSVRKAIDQVIREHGQVIFLEDDNVVSSNFLDFMNNALAFYSDDQSVFSISGYTYPIVIPPSYPYDIFKWKGFSAWGVGLWQDRWNSIDWAYPSLSELSRGKPLKRKIDQVAEHLYYQMVYDIRHGVMTADTVITYNMMKDNKYSIFPVVSKVRNTGKDGTGEHGGIAESYSLQRIDSGLSFRFERDLHPDKRIDRVLRRHFRTPAKARLIRTLSPFVPERLKSRIRAWRTRRMGQS